MKTDALKEEICRTAGRKVRTPNDFEWLSEKIWERTHKRLSPTTLKRFFGYIEEGVATRVGTLDILARYVGYQDYETFLESDGEAQSNVVAAGKIISARLEKGKVLTLTWQPDRVCVIRYLGQGLFEILKRENTKLEVGDIFECSMFLNREPLYISNIRRNEMVIIDTYLIGRKDGVMIEE